MALSQLPISPEYEPSFEQRPVGEQYRIINLSKAIRKIEAYLPDITPLVVQSPDVDGSTESAAPANNPDETAPAPQPVPRDASNAELMREAYDMLSQIRSQN